MKTDQLEQQIWISKVLEAILVLLCKLNKKTWQTFQAELVKYT